MSDDTYAVIMAGGKGERFWPMSTARTPKQLLSLVGGAPLVALAVERLDGLIPPERVLIITSASLEEVTAAAVPSLPRENIIGEPFGRDTAAAVALASALVKHRSSEGTFCILTADHIMRDLDIFRKTISTGFEIAAEKDVLITIGMTPTSPSTGFGYIESEVHAETRNGIEFLEARRFVEKPDEATAEEYVASGKYFWNSGMFIWSVTAIQNALSAHQPALYEMAQRIEKVVGTGKFAAALKDEYEGLEKISVDYAIMEKVKNILMAQGTFYWDDVGSWVALENHFEKDDDGNLVVGNSESVDSSGNVVVSEKRLTALIGVDDLVVVQAEGATLICHKDRAQDVKKMVALLKETGKHDHLL